MTEYIDSDFTTVSIEKELKKSYLEYAMSVIVGRALPDVRDGLKPVHRRALFAMYDLNNVYNRPYLKSARVVGDVIGKYHPHGDVAVYDTIVRMAQPFSMRYLLVDGQGNFGSLDGDAPAAMRYTEVRMTKIDQEMTADIEKETVDFVPNYDNNLVEPVVFPSKIPNLLLNGSSGIAVGMATNIPPHNLTEIMNGLIALIDDPHITISQLMEHIKAPDFPTGAFICGRSGTREAYETGRGTIRVRARHHIEKKAGSGKECIVFTEIPFQQNKARLIEKIAILIKDKKIESISEVRDESDRDGTRIFLELKKDEVADVVLNQLYKFTPLETTFGIILLCIVNNKPEILNLKQILEHFLLHRKTIVFRRTVFELKKAEEKAHILSGLKTAISNLDEVISIIKSASEPQEAKVSLIKRFDFSEIQAQAILDMRLQRLTGFEREKIIEELSQLEQQIIQYREIISNEKLIMDIIRSECDEIKNNFGDDRRTEIIDATEDVQLEDLIVPEDMVVTVTNSGYIKRNPANLYRLQRRGGKGIRGMETREEDYVTHLYFASTHDTLLFFTNLGKVFWRKVYEIPQTGRVTRGKAIVNLLELAADEKVAAILPVKSFDGGENAQKSILMVTKLGIVKKTLLGAFKYPLRKGIIALKIREDDEIITAAIISGEDDIILISKNGKSIRFKETDIRAMGRVATGLKGITLVSDDVVVGVVVFKEETSVLAVTENGYGKRSPTTEYRVQKRGGRGVIAIKVNERNGKVVGALPVEEDDAIMLITKTGQVIRMKMDMVRVIGRNTQGVRLINLDAGETVVGLDRVVERLGEEDGQQDDV